MIWDIISGFLPSVWPLLAGALVAVGAYFTGRSKGAAKAKQKQAEATVKGVVAGAKGAAKADAQIRAGQTPEEIVRGNDASWQ